MNAQQRKKLKKTKGKRHDSKVTRKKPLGRHVKTAVAPACSQETKYDPAMAAKVKMLVIELGCVNQRGDIAWKRIAKLIGVSVETLRNWRKKSSPCYHEDFAQAVAEAVASVDTGKIKRGLIQAAKPHVEVTRFRERRRGKLIVVRETRRPVVDSAAAKFVLPNYGPPGERWTVKEQRTHDVTDEFAELLREIGDQPMTLPSQEMNDQARVQGKVQEPILEAQSPVLDHG